MSQIPTDLEEFATCVGNKTLAEMSYLRIPIPSVSKHNFAFHKARIFMLVFAVS